MKEAEKANELIDKFGSITLAIECCNEVLGYMGTDREYIFWNEVKAILIQKRRKINKKEDDN